MNMRVTIIADASFCDENKVGGYGYWISSDRGRRGGGDEFKGRVNTNVIAEMMAICNALYVGIATKLVDVGDEVLLQTDCIPAIDAFCDKLREPCQQTVEVAKKLREAADEKGLKITFRHVRGHTQQQAPRYTANRLCDKRAKEAMRRARSRVTINQIKELFES